MSPLDARLLTAAVLGAVVIILAIVFRNKLRAEGGQYVATFAIILGIVVGPALAQFIEQLL
jgi:hypothetical protein